MTDDFAEKASDKTRPSTTTPLLFKSLRLMKYQQTQKTTNPKKMYKASLF
jgi:hypothetical protein